MAATTSTGENLQIDEGGEPVSGPLQRFPMRINEHKPAQFLRKKNPLQGV